MKNRLFHFSFLLIFFSALTSANKKNAGYYIGSFDMFTRGHELVLDGALNNPDLDIGVMYVTINHNTDKDFNASIDERETIAKLLTAKYGDRVVVLREPLEGRVAFANYLRQKHHSGDPRKPAKVIVVVGDDTYDKNYKIFTTNGGVVDLDYAKVARPEIAVSSLESYIPVTHNMTINDVGTSSSKARALIAEGKDPVAEGVLSQAAYDYIRERGLYLEPKPEERKAKEEEFISRYEEFASKMKSKFPGYDWANLGKPNYKSTQSTGAQNDKFIRHLVESFKMGLDEQFKFRPVAEKELGIHYKTAPLRSPQKIGIFMGSFDNPSAEQRAAIAASLTSGNLDKLHIWALGKSRKPIANPLDQRVAAMRELTKEFGDKVVVGSIPTLEGSPLEVRRLSNEHSQPTLMIFGENVFEANRERLKDVPNLNFAKVPFGNPGHLEIFHDILKDCLGGTVSLVKTSSVLESY